MHFATLTILALVSSVVSQGDAQKSKKLLDRLVQKIDNGGGAKDPGQVASAVSENNFINFCATKNLPLTNGKQVKTGSCNPTPQGVILATDRMPACKFVDPPNLGVVKANENFTISLKIENWSTGFFTDPANTYYAAPQDTNNDRFAKGHSHVTINKIDSITTTKINPAATFAFFKGLNEKADENGILKAVVAGGLEEGDYRACSINSAANHQPLLVAVAQHASLDDCIYFTATADGKEPQDDNSNGDNGDASNSNNGNGNDEQADNAPANEDSETDGNKASEGSSGKGNGSNKGNSNKDKESSKEEDRQEAARCRAKRLRRRAAHQKRAAELERMRRQRRA